MAMTLSSLARTKLILGTADRDTATWCSDFIGRRQVRDMEEGYTYGYNNARDAVSLTPRKHIEPLLLPDQLMNLPRLSGYINVPDGFPAAPVKLRTVTRPKRAEAVIARARDRVQAAPPTIPEEPSPDGRRGTSNAGQHPASNDDGVGKPAVPKQGELALAQSSPVSERGDENPPLTPPRDAPSLTPERVATAGDAGERDPNGQTQQGPAGAKPTYPKDAVLRAGASEAEVTRAEGKAGEHGRDGLGKTDRETEPPVLEKPAGREAAAAARKLMLEDGVPERDGAAKDGPDLGDLEL
jgi:hypothetical protein